MVTTTMAPAHSSAANVGRGMHPGAAGAGSEDEEDIIIDMVDEDDDDNDLCNNGQPNEKLILNDNDTCCSRQVASNGTACNGSIAADLSNSASFSAGDLVWFDPNLYGYSIPGKVLDHYADLNVMTVEGCGQSNPSSQVMDAERIVNMDEYNKQLLEADEQLQVYDLSDPQMFRSVRYRKPISNEYGCSNLVDLDEHSIESLIWNLKLRFKQDSIYTQCGHKILVSVNPNRQLNSLYSLDQVQQYDTLNTVALQSVLRDQSPSAISNLVRWLLIEQPMSSGGSKMLQLDQSPTHLYERPHLFQMANEALKRLLVGGQDQCFVLLGDSGSGKTEASKLLVQYLATVNKSPSNVVTEQILESIQVLESFGNAKTIENNNSSRFAKMLDLRFNLSTTLISDAQTFDLNLLDRTRIVSQCESERNYHIFYELLAGLSSGEREKYGLQSAEKYFYLNQGHCTELATKEDGADFRALLASMQVLGFNCEELDTIFRLLASILHLGNIYFHRKLLSFTDYTSATTTAANDGSATNVEGVEIGSDTEVRWVSHLLQIQFDSVLRCLTCRTIETGQKGGESNQQQQRIVTPLNIDQALDARDAIARALYTCLFKWLVQRINAAISKQQSSLNDGGPLASTGSNNGCPYSANDLPSYNMSNSKEVVHTGPNSHINHEDDVGQHKGDDQDDDDDIDPEQEIYLCRTSESLCEFQPNKLSASSERHSLRNKRKDLERSRRHRDSNQLTRRLVMKMATISILDAFGFEKLGENNFEQLCINYAAELLHCHTYRYLIRLEQDEYARERLRWTPIELIGQSSFNSPSTDNCSDYATSSTGTAGRSSATALINLIAKKPLGILALLDDECNFPKATDQSFAEKCHHNHALNDNYQCARLAANCQEFGIRHFKQNNRLVWYQVDGFIEKNRDSLRPDIMNLLLGSKMPIVGDMLRKLTHTGSLGPRSNGSSTGGSSYNSLRSKTTLSRTHDGRYVTMKPRAGTVAARFLDALHHNRTIEALSCATAAMPVQYNGGPLPQTEIPHHIMPQQQQEVMAFTTAAASVWFVVCLKPNRSKAAHVFDVAYVQEQVKALHLKDLVQMRRVGFPVRMRYGEFVRRYKCLVPQRYLNKMTSFCQSARLQQQQQQHRSKRSHKSSVQDDNNNSNHENELRRAIREVCSSIVEFRFTFNLPKDDSVRGRVKESIRSQYQCGLTKMFLNEKLYHQLEHWRLIEYQKAIAVIQKTVRMWSLRRRYLLQRQAAIVIQSNFRCWLAQRDYWRKYTVLVMLQRRWRLVSADKRCRRAEAQRRAQRAQQRRQLEEIQSRQHKLANQNRYRCLVSAPPSDPSKSSGGSNSGYGYATAGGLLDIPEDLAHLYRLSRTWAPVHDLSNIEEINLDSLIVKELKRRKRLQRRPSSSSLVPLVVIDDDESDGGGGRSDEGCQLSAKIDAIIERLESRADGKYSLDKFLLRYYSIEVPQFGYSRLPIMRPFSYKQLLRRRQSELCKLNLDGDDDRCATDPVKSNQIAMDIERQFEMIIEKSLAMYKLLMRYIDCDQPTKISNEDGNACDLTSGRVMKFKLLGDYIIDLCLSEPQLRNEIYLQLASLVWQNPRQKSVENCWRLFLNALHCFDPSDRALTNYLLIYANNYCCDQYRKQVCKLLVKSMQQSSRGANRDRTSQRVYPASLLEFWSNQTGVCRFALRANCLTDLDEPEEQQTSGVAPGAIDITNYSNKTLVEVDWPRMRAEEFAAKLLQARQVPESNLFGWSVEVEHESGGMSDLSSRLRGEDCLMDHFGQIELLPELAQLIDDERQRQQQQQVSIATATPGKGTFEDDCAECLAGARGRGRRSSMSSLQSNQHRWSSAHQQQHPVPLVPSTETRACDLNCCRRQAPQNKAPFPPPTTGGSNRWSRADSLASSSCEMSAHRLVQHRRSMSMQELQMAQVIAGGAHRCSGNNNPPQRMIMQDRDSYTAYEQDNCISPPQGKGSSQHYASSYVRGGEPAKGRSGPPTRTSSLLRSNEYPQRLGSQQDFERSCESPYSSHHFRLRLPPRRSATPSGTSSSHLQYGPPRECAPITAVKTGVQQQQTSRAPHKPMSASGRLSSSAQAGSHLGQDRSTAGSVDRHHTARPQRSASSSSKTGKNLSRIRPKEHQTNKQINPHGNNLSSLHYASSALSDTSEAPSMASHVRAVKVPRGDTANNADDLDRYLDDLFNPMLAEADLDELSDAKSLAASIRGTAQGQQEAESNKENDQVFRSSPKHEDNSRRQEEGEPNEQRAGRLSPTFESLLKSLRTGSEPSAAAQSTREPGTLEKMNLSQLRALNEQLEQEIQAAQSASRRSLEQVVNAAGLTAYPMNPVAVIDQPDQPPPRPPPQPMFEVPSKQAVDSLTSNAGATSMADDIYSRAKTIRIGKWRWPPALDESAGPATGKENALAPSKRPGDNLEEQQQQQQQQQIADSAAGTSSSVGRLKLSSEMKAKLEQLTNSSDKPVCSQAASGLQQDAPSCSKPKRLADNRRNLLEHQLLGSSNQSDERTSNEDHTSRQKVTSEQSGEQRLSSGSKVLAVKQQLAAAAGVALEALGGSGNSSQVSSRRQSGVVATGGVPPTSIMDTVTVANSNISAVPSARHALAREELGPQSRAAIGQRQAFYGLSAATAEGRAHQVVGADTRLQAAEQSTYRDGTGSVLSPPNGADERADSAYMRPGVSEGHNEECFEAVATTADGSDQWVASSPDPTLLRASKGKTRNSGPVQVDDNRQRAPATGALDGKRKVSKGGSGLDSVSAKRAAGSGNKSARQNRQCLVYANVDWQIRVRKEIFMPSETYDHPLVVQLIFAQLVYDVFNPRQHCTRLNNKERAAIKSIMKDNSIGYEPQLPKIGQMQSIKQDLVRLARSFGLYFARTYPAHNHLLISYRPSNRSANQSDEDDMDGHSDDDYDCGDDEDQSDALDNDFGQANKIIALLDASNSLGEEWIDMVGVHHSGLRLVSFIDNEANNRAPAKENRLQQTPTGVNKQPQATNYSSAGYKVFETLKFRDMERVIMIGPNEMLVQMRNGRKSWLLGSLQATQLNAILKRFHGDYCKHFKTDKSTTVKPNTSNGAPVASSYTKSNRLKTDKQTSHNKKLAPAENKQPQQSRQNDLLASDNGYDGADFEERQTANSVERLRQATCANNDLANGERGVHNSVANSRTKITTIERQQQSAYNTEPVNSDVRRSSNPSFESASSSASAPTSAPASGNSSNGGLGGNSANSSHSNKLSGCIASGGAPHRHNVSPGSGRAGSSGGRAELTGMVDSSCGSAAAATNIKQSGSSQRQSATSSLWQNSLSKMSSKFSLIATKESKETRSAGRKSRKNKQQLVDDKDESPIVLDAWVETKVDFDDEDDDEGDVVENTVDHAEDGSTTVGRQTEVKSMDERCRLASSMNERDSSHSSSGSYHSQRPKGESENSDGCASSGPRDDGKYSMLQFALHNFQEALEKYPLGARPVSKSGAHQASNNDDMNTKPSNNHNDTSTLRGSLKLIERLRGNSCAGSHQVNSSRDSSSDWTWRELADMVKFTRIPIRRSLLRLQQGVSSANDAELERKACECFVAIMQFMGDLNKSTKLPPNVLPCNNEVECVYLLLINLHNCLILRNEVYCQLIKQTTNNRSDQPDSCLRGWRLFSIVAAYFDCSPEFKPYLLKHLEGAAYDKRRAYSQVASICLQNLRKTLKYGGRKNVPSIEEIAATSAGRNSKRQIYRLPGGTERVINTKSTTVVDDIIHEICSQMLNVTDLDEMREFSLYCIADLDDDDGTNVDSSGRDQVQQQHCATMPLNGDEYILDITTELIKSHRQYFLIFCRSIWHYPLRLDSKLYIEVIFNQIAPDYLEGLLLVMSSGSLQFSSAHRKTRSSSSSSMSSSSTGGRTSNGGHGLRLKGKVVREIARLAALLQRASGSDREPQQEELRYLLPKPVVASMRRGDIGFDVVDSSEDNYATQSDLQATASTDGQRPNWLELVQRYWHEMSAFDTLDAKAQFLDIVRHWPLFGSSFFAIKLIQRDLIQPIDYILALNKLGIQMLDQLTHETMHCYAFNEVVSTRKVRSEDGALFLDLKCGNLIKRTIVRIQTDQAHEINRLIKQYIEIDLRRHQQQQQQHQQPVTSSQNDARNQL